MRDIAILRTARLLLRPLRPEDAAAVTRGVGDRDVARWLGAVPFPYRLSDAERFLESPAAVPRRAWAVCDLGGLVGAVSVDGELGYWLAREAWGRGFATEAVEAAVSAAFADPQRRSLEAAHVVGNDRSARLLARLGFRETGNERCFVWTLGHDVPIRRTAITRARWGWLGKRRRGACRRCRMEAT